MNTLNKSTHEATTMVAPVLFLGVGSDGSRMAEKSCRMFRAAHEAHRYCSALLCLETSRAAVKAMAQNPSEGTFAFYIPPVRTAENVDERCAQEMREPSQENGAGNFRQIGAARLMQSMRHLRPQLVAARNHLGNPKNRSRCEIAGLQLRDETIVLIFANTLGGTGSSACVFLPGFIRDVMIGSVKIVGLFSVIDSDYAKREDFGGRAANGTATLEEIHALTENRDCEVSRIAAAVSTTHARAMRDTRVVSVGNAADRVFLFSPTNSDSKSLSTLDQNFEPLLDLIAEYGMCLCNTDVLVKLFESTVNDVHTNQGAGQTKTTDAVFCTGSLGVVEVPHTHIAKAARAKLAHWSIERMMEQVSEAVNEAGAKQDVDRWLEEQILLHLPGLLNSENGLTRLSLKTVADFSEKLKDTPPDELHAAAKSFCADLEETVTNSLGWGFMLGEAEPAAQKIQSALDARVVEITQTRGVAYAVTWLKSLTENLLKSPAPMPKGGDLRQALDRAAVEYAPNAATALLCRSSDAANQFRDRDIEIVRSWMNRLITSAARRAIKTCVSKLVAARVQALANGLDSFNSGIEAERDKARIDVATESLLPLTPTRTWASQDRSTVTTEAEQLIAPLLNNSTLAFILKKAAGYYLTHDEFVRCLYMAVNDALAPRLAKIGELFTLKREDLNLIEAAMTKCNPQIEFVQDYKQAITQAPLRFVYAPTSLLPLVEQHVPSSFSVKIYPTEDESKLTVVGFEGPFSKNDLATYELGREALALFEKGQSTAFIHKYGYAAGGLSSDVDPDETAELFSLAAIVGKSSGVFQQGSVFEYKDRRGVKRVLDYARRDELEASVREVGRNELLKQLYCRLSELGVTAEDAANNINEHIDTLPTSKRNEVADRAGRLLAHLNGHAA